MSSVSLSDRNLLVFFLDCDYKQEA